MLTLIHLEDDMISGAKKHAQSVRLQEEMNRRFNDVYIINKVDAPTRVGQY